MDKNLAELMMDQGKTNEAHIFYHFHDNDKYLQNALNFIMTVLSQGFHVMLVDNDRNFIHLKSLLKKQLKEEEFEKIHFINNFEFYYSNGDFHAQTIFDYFKVSIQPYLDEEYEKNFDLHIKDKGIISVCAYDAKRTTKRLQQILMKCHEVMLTDDQLHNLVNDNAI